MVPEWTVIVVHGGWSPLVAPHVREGWESRRGGAAGHVAVKRHVLRGQKGISWRQCRRAGAQEQRSPGQHAANGRQGASWAVHWSVQGTRAAGAGVIPPVAAVIICSEIFISQSSSMNEGNKLCPYSAICDNIYISTFLQTYKA